VITTLYSFIGGADGRYPGGASLVRDTAGNLYGTTPFGGTSDLGTIFKVDPSGNETVLHTFIGGADGAYPQGGLIKDPAGNFYGTTEEGGGTGCENLGCGMVFELTP
jgi:uncharacterized repeat protein (TIGR03803 family)